MVLMKDNLLYRLKVQRVKKSGHGTLPRRARLVVRLAYLASIRSRAA